MKTRGAFTACLALGLCTLLLCVAVAPAGANAGDRYRTKVLVRGAVIHGANGLAVNAQGRLVVASGLGNEIDLLDPLTGRLLERLGHGNIIDYAGPDDVAAGPDGSIYWTDFPTGQVGRLAPDGTVTRQSVAPGMNPIAFTAGGRLFVGSAFAGDGLYELDPNLVLPPRVVIPDSGQPPFPGQLNGFDFGPDGKLYAPQPFLQKIVSIDPDSGAMTVVADVSAAGHPGSVEFDSKGHLYASMADTNLVLRIDPTRGTYSVFVALPATSLDNMVFDARDRLFVSDAYDGRVYLVAPGGGVRTFSRGGIMLPGGIALMRNDAGRERLFVADMWRVVQFRARSGTLVGSDTYSHLGGSIVNAFTVTPDAGDLIISSWMSNAVQIWDPAAKAQVAIFRDFGFPLNAIRFQGDLVVAQAMPGSVVRKDAETGVISTLAGSLVLPAGLAATDDDLWVADWVTGTVWKIVADGAVLASPQVVAGGLLFPEGMAVDRDGSLLVVESGTGKLLRIDASGGVTTVADGLMTGLSGSPASPPTWALSSVAVGGDGKLYVTGDAGDIVYRLKPLPAK